MPENNKHLRDGFGKWYLRKSNSLTKTNRIVESLEVVNHYINNKQGKLKELHLITNSKELVNMFQFLRTETDFHLMNIKHKNKCYEAIIAYIDYMRDCEKAGKEDHHSLPGERTLTDIFSDKKYEQFLSALKKNGITSLDQLSNMNLFVFMNENKIGTGRKRFALLFDIRQIIEAADTPATTSFKEKVDENKETVIVYKTAQEITIEADNAKLESQVEEYLKKRRLTPSTIDDIRQDLSARRNIVHRIVSALPGCVEIKKERYIHRDSIVDLEEAADAINGILKSQFEKFHGYSTARLLCDAVRIDLPLFLNDNDFEDEETIYFLTKHLFSKERYGGNNYVFYGNMHIWQQEPDYPKSIKGLLIHYARKAKQTIRTEECESFLKKLGHSTHNIKQQMEIKKDPTFLQCDKDEFMLGETLGINEEWISIVANRISLLFHDNPFVIPRDIQHEWYESLPQLPFGQTWTCLLLQDILGFYSAIGYRTIPALANQSMDTIHAAIVPNDSPITTFADFVSAFLFNEKITKQRITAEELRLLLRKCGAIDGNELHTTMHKALDDYRFAWDNENKTVFVNIG